MWPFDSNPNHISGSKHSSPIGNTQGTLNCIFVDKVQLQTGLHFIGNWEVRDSGECIDLPPKFQMAWPWPSAIC